MYRLTRHAPALACLIAIAAFAQPLYAAGALEQVQQAARKNASGAVIAHATVASEQAFLGRAQSDYPLVRVD